MSGRRTSGATRSGHACFAQLRRGRSRATRCRHVIVVIVEREVTDVLATDLLAHQTTDLELHDALGRHLDLLERARVLRAPCCAIARLEDTELAELESVALGQLVDDRVQEGLDDLLGNNLGDTSLVSDPIDEFLLGDSFHQQPPWRRVLSSFRTAWIGGTSRSVCIK